MLVTTTIGIPPDIFEKTVRYNINRSKVSREAIVKECERIEKEAGEIAAKQNPRPVSTELKPFSYSERDT